jgi:tetratricopeptide (TPR) repeat protein
LSARPKADRDVIPRWRGYRETALLGELDSPPTAAAPFSAAHSELLRRRAEAWRSEGSLGFAADLVNSAVVLGPTPESLYAAEQVLQADIDRPLLKEAARRLKDLYKGGDASIESAPPDPPPFPDEIHRLRRSLRKNIRNAIRWSELARFHTIAGHRDKALRAMRIARGLAPQDRYVLRCAVRLEIHLGRSDRAARLVAESGMAMTDPWLVAAGLGAAGAAGEPSTLFRTGQRLLAAQSHSEFATSELASALGTIEARAGGDRVARRLFRRSLVDPTDNAIAQAEWASRHVAGISVSAVALAKPRSWEARAWTAAKDGEHSKAVEEAWRWHDDQPFASRPAELSSYQAAMRADFAEGVRCVEAALRSNRDEFPLLNNLAFCLASLDQPDRATEKLERLRPASLSKGNRATYLATSGVIAFRKGQLERGRALYEQSMELCDDPTDRALALIMLAREELRIGAPGADELEREARDASERLQSPDLEAWIEQLEPASKGRRLTLIKRPNGSTGS